MWRRKSCVQVCNTRLKAGVAPDTPIHLGLAANSVRVCAVQANKVSITQRGCAPYKPFKLCGKVNTKWA